MIDKSVIDKAKLIKGLEYIKFDESNYPHEIKWHINFINGLLENLLNEVKLGTFDLKDK